MMLLSATIAAKMYSRLLLVAIGVIAMAFGRSEAITCYQCSSVTDSKCSDPSDSNGIATCHGTACFIAYIGSSGWRTTLISLYHLHAILQILLLKRSEEH